MNEQPRKSLFKRWWFWVILIVIIGGLSVLFMSFATSDEKKAAQEKENLTTKELSQEQLKSAEKAFANGITVSDAKDDFIIGLEGSDATYSVPEFDIKSMSFGIGDKFYYQKCTYWSPIPKTGFTVNTHGDFQMNCTHQIYIDNEQNKVTKWGKGQYHMLTTNYDYPKSLLGIELFLDLPEGSTEQETDYEGNPYNIKRDFGGMAYGGAGYDYVIGAWPLSELGVKTGDAITIRVNTEIGASGRKVHYAIDMVPQAGSKDDQIIEWILGQNTYQKSTK